MNSGVIVRWVQLIVVFLALSACSENAQTQSLRPPDASPDSQDSEIVEHAEKISERPEYIAPSNALEHEEIPEKASIVAKVGREDHWGPAYRVDADPSEHIGFRLDFVPEKAEIDLEILAWDGEKARSMGQTNWAPGLRTLAAFDPFDARTFWARARGSISKAQLTVTRTQFEKGPVCHDDCDRLLQLPLPIDSKRQGYRLSSQSVFAYQFGRRDLLMALFQAGYRVAEQKISPFEIKRLSRWDGGTPPSHNSHKNGVDVDISLYTEDGHPVWYALCHDLGRLCKRRTRSNFGGKQMAVVLAGLFESGLFGNDPNAVVFMDREFHRALRGGADQLLEKSLIKAEIRELFEPKARIIQHIESHHHHLHIRVGQ